MFLEKSQVATLKCLPLSTWYNWASHHFGQRRHHQLGSKQSLAWMSWSRAFGIAWCSHQSMRLATWQKKKHEKNGSVTINRWGVTSKNLPVIPMFIQRFSMFFPSHLHNIHIPWKACSIYHPASTGSSHTTTWQRVPSGGRSLGSPICAKDEIQWLCKKKMEKNEIQW